MSKRTITFQTTLDLRAVALLSVLLLLLGFIILPAVAGAFPRSDDPEPQAYDAQNADKVDNHHAGPSSGTKAKRANRVLWADKNGRLHWKAMPQGTLNRRYLNDDRKETISAAVEDAYVLTVENTSTGLHPRGLYASAQRTAIQGSGDIYGVVGSSTDGTGLYGTTIGGTAVFADAAGGGLALKVEGYSGDNLIEAYDGYAGLDKLRFAVTRSGLLMVGQLSSPPACGTSTKGAIYYDTDVNIFYGCNGSAWQALN